MSERRAIVSAGMRGRLAAKARRLLVCLAASLAIPLAAGCAERAPEVDPSSPQIPALVALSVEHHKLADLALQRGDRDEAKARVADLLEQARRYRVRTPEGYDVVFDAATRLARMHLEDDELDKAEAAARRGLEEESGAPPTLFRGYLHQVLGDILEKRGDLRGAVDEHTEAIKIFKAILDAEVEGRSDTTDRDGE